MAQQPLRGGQRRRWLVTATIALTALVSLTVPMPAPAQEAADPIEALRLEFDACIASGVDGADCAAAATLTLQAIISGNTESAETQPTPEAGTAGSQVNGSAGGDGQTSNGGDQALGADTSVESAPVAETTPVPPVESTTSASVEDTAAPPVAVAPPPAETAPPAGTITTTSTTTDTGTTNESASTLSGGAQTNDASGTDGGRRRDRD